MILLVLRALSCDKVESDIVLGILRQVHVLHSCVGDVNLLLEATLLLANFTHEHCHLTEDDSVVENEADKNGEDVDDLKVSTGSHLVTTESQYGHVEHDHVLVPLVDGFEVIETSIADALDVNEVKWRHPFSIQFNDQKEDAADDVQRKKHD